MKISAAPLLLLVVLVAGCESVTIDLGDEPAASQPIDSPHVCPFVNVPAVDLPVALRHANYAGGSCLWAAFQDVLAWQNREQDATYCRQNCAGGAGVTDVTAVCDRRGLDYACTTSGDADFLEWASETRRGAAIYWHGGAHAITFCGFVGNKAVIIDNNSPGKEQWLGRGEFLSEWRAAGGVAVTTVYAPLPPRPWI